MTDPKKTTPVAENDEEIEAPAVEGQGTFLGMSDEELMKAGPPVMADAPAVVDEPAAAAKTPPVVAPVVPVVDEEDEDLPDTTQPPKTEKPAGSKEPAADGGTPAKPGDAGDKGEVPADDKTVKPAADAVAIDYKAEYERLIKPFKANGREVQVKDVNDAIALMQMGANYNKKMAGLKPNFRLLKMLENNGLLSEEKIGWLIDLDKKNPEAINKLVKDSGLNPMDLDADKAGEYKPKTHSVDDREIDLDTVLDEISSTGSYNRTLEVVSKQWDGASKQVIAGQPQLLKVINDHMESGIYDLISKEVESERVFGRLNGKSDLEAYRQVGDAIQARGGFDNLGSSQNKDAKPPVVVAPKPKQLEDEALKEKRRAAGGSKPAATGAVTKEFNPLAMSDEDFLKQAAPILT